MSCRRRLDRRCRSTPRRPTRSGAGRPGARRADAAPGLPSKPRRTCSRRRRPPRPTAEPDRESCASTTTPPRMPTRPPGGARPAVDPLDRSSIRARQGDPIEADDLRTPCTSRAASTQRRRVDRLHRGRRRRRDVGRRDLPRHRAADARAAHRGQASRGAQAAEVAGRAWAWCVLVVAALAVLGSSLFAIDDVEVDRQRLHRPDRLQAVVDDLVGTPVLLADTQRPSGSSRRSRGSRTPRSPTHFPHGVTIEIRERAPVRPTKARRQVPGASTTTARARRARRLPVGLRA